MGVKDSSEKGVSSSEKGVSGGQLALGILLVAILWRAVISLDGEISFWESLCSGLALILLGWVLFAYAYRRSRELKGWIISNYIYQGIAVCLVIINVYTLVYYGMRWYKLLTVEAYLPWDFIFRDVRYFALVVFYCSVIWSEKYVTKMHEEYLSRSKGKTVLHLISPYLHPRGKGKKLREMDLEDLVSTVITDERTLVVLIGLTFLWRIFISLDYKIALWESLGSGVALILLGWLVFAYIYSQSRKQRGWLDLVKVYRGTALGVLAMNLYALAYYGMRWYRLAFLEEAFVPWDFLFRDVRYFALVMFYCAAIVLSQFLKRAYEEYTLLSTEKPSKPASG
jgi:Ca2+/Na+ antiporter